MSVLRHGSALGLLVVALGAVADEPPSTFPSDDFLEYLGSWEGNEEDWLAVGRDAVPPEKPKESGRQSGNDDPTADQERQK
jgi:hypothetical protein